MAAQAKVDGACQGLERAGFVWEQGFCLHSFDRAKACAGASLAIFASRHPKYWPLPLSQLKLGGWARKTQNQVHAGTGSPRPPLPARHL